MKRSSVPRLVRRLTNEFYSLGLAVTLFICLCPLPAVRFLEVEQRPNLPSLHEIKDAKRNRKARRRGDFRGYGRVFRGHQFT